MNIALESEAEKYAEKAEDLQAFLGIKLLDIKQKVAELADFIGRNGFFLQYTKHDISHIEGMLDILSWVIPQNTKEIMTSADWLLIVLAVYFHDLGLIVTEEEYKARNLTGFPEYCDKELFAGDDGKDYQARVKQYYPDPDQAERFFYQEFVRHYHAERVAAWITGRAPANLGYNSNVMQEIQKIVDPLKPLFRRDLALICESHHLYDLNNFKKYNVSQPYRGHSKPETANLQYVAALLRTVDLLHITSDRTPSISFRLINPTDPISQAEWVKQEAVNSVRPKIILDEEDRTGAKPASDTIEVHAYFLDQNGFFGLTSYLPYVSDEIEKTYKWVKEAKNRFNIPYDFPWRYIDDNVDSKGFIRGEFGFEIDQKKILNLLTGHMLYNDTNVVIRELVQNSLDAVRLQHFIDPTSGEGKVEINWDSHNRVLCVTDNGTGMTQEIIKDHFLKVGVSRYQDDNFRKQYPQFSSISRFGIGVLSTFMIANTVEVTTCHPDDGMARQISLRSVHDRYLIQSLEKDSGELPKEIFPHGTCIRLTVRASADNFNILEAAQKWIVVPNCSVRVTIDGLTSNIGFSSTKDAVEDIVRRMGKSIDNSLIKVEERELNDITLAYALRWSQFFQEWTFLRAPIKSLSDGEEVFLGTCVEGVRVEFESPGFRSNSIIAIANATGLNAPKTNVARSGLDVPGRDKMLQTIYALYCEHVEREMRQLYEERGFSITWATQEANYLLRPILSKRGGSSLEIEPINTQLLMDNVRSLPMLLVEFNEERKNISPKNFLNEKYFWTIFCPLFKSAEYILREVPSDSSLSNIIKALHTNKVQLPKEPVLCGFDLYDDLYQIVYENKEVDKIIIYKDQRRVDLRWTNKDNKPRWRGLHEISSSSIKRRRRVRNLYIALPNCVEISGDSDEIGVKGQSIYIFPNSSLADFLIKQLNDALNSADRDKLERAELVFEVIFLLLSRFNDYTSDNVNRYLRQIASENGIQSSILDIKEIQSALVGFRIYDPSAWVRDDPSSAYYDSEW